MKILLVYRSWYNSDFFNGITIGGMERFCKLIYKHYQNIELLQVKDEESLDMSKSERIKSREQIQEKIIKKSQEVDADLIILNWFDSSATGKKIIKSSIPILYINHAIEYILSRLNSFRKIKENNHSLYFVSQYQKNHYDIMSKRINDKQIDFDGYIEPAFVSGVKPKVVDNPEFDCVTIGRSCPHKNPFLLKELTKGTSLRTLVISNEIKENDIHSYPYYTKNKNYNDVLWNLNHDDVLKNLSRGKVFFSSWPHETFGITSLEALSCGLPVILSCKNNSHASEILFTDKTKHFYRKIEHKNKEELINAINSFKDIDRKEIRDMTWGKYTQKRWKSLLDNAIDKTIENFKSHKGEVYPYD